MKFKVATFLSIFMLYAGKTSGILVAFLFLPFYNKLLGAEQFGVVAVILSFQVLLVMMDLGLSTIIGRVISLGEGGALRLLRTADLALILAYSFLTLCVMVFKQLGLLSGVSWIVVLGSMLLFLIMVLHNLYYSALIANRKYVIGSALQVIGGLTRACATAIALMYISATLEVFIFAQLIITIGQALISRNLCMQSFDADDIKKSISLAEVATLVRSGYSLILFSIAGAAVTQLDKPLISIFLSTAAVTPYYLANLLCATPMSILAGPVNQYFQPVFFKAASKININDARKVLRDFVLCIFTVIAIPVFFLWWLRAPIIKIWIGESGDVFYIIKYVEILLPGVAIGALGFVPYTLLILAKDYKFQAFISSGLTIITLSLVVVASKEWHVEGVCIVYSSYHIVSTICSWGRAIKLTDTRVYAIYSARLVLMLLSGMLFLLWLLTYLIQ